MVQKSFTPMKTIIKVRTTYFTLIVWDTILQNRNNQFGKIKNERKNSVSSCSSIRQIDTTYETKKEDQVKNTIIHKERRTIFSPERNHRRVTSNGDKGKTPIFSIIEFYKFSMFRIFNSNFEFRYYDLCK